MKTSILVYLLFLGIKFSCVYGYRDGARENSCFNHTIDHGTGSFLIDCDPTSMPPCRYFLIIKEVVNEATLELGNQTEYYECGKIYGVEVANSLNPAEGFLVQARSGPEDSSEIIGTFLDPSVVRERDPGIPIYYKILNCQRNQSAGPELYPNSATHPDTVNTAEKLQLFWRAPNCTEETLPTNLTMWFTIVQQLLIGYRPAKHIILTYIPPPEVLISSSAVPFSSSAVMSLLPSSTPQGVVHVMPTPTPELPTTEQMQPSQATTTQTDAGGAELSQEQIIGLGAGAGGGLVVLIIIVVIIIVLIGIKVVKKEKSAGKESPLTPESNGERIDSMKYSNLTKEHEENDHELFNGGKEENSYITFKQPSVIVNENVEQA